MLTAYFDESGHSKDPKSQFCGMGGFTADSTAWERLSEVWRAALAEAGVSGAFHMRHFAHRRGEFKGWTEEQRQSLFGKLVDVIAEIDAVPTGCVISLDDFNEAPPSLKTFFKGPYFMAFQMATRGAALEAFPKDCRFELQTVDMVFAEQKEFGATSCGTDGQERQAGDAQRLWLALKRMTDYGRWMGSFLTDSPENSPPLQAADLFAYELTKEFENLVKRPDDDMRWALRRILTPTRERPKQLIQFYDSHEMLRVYLEATGQENNPKFQAVLTKSWLLKTAVRQLMEIRIRRAEGDASLHPL